MLLVFDIGNTNICIGVFKADKLSFEFRLKTDAGRTLDEYRALLLTLFSSKLGDTYTFTQCVISSVVPPITPDIVQLVKESFNIDPLLVGPGIKTGISVRVQEPTTVGADRIVNSVAAKFLFGAPAIVIDFGTATTFDYLSAEGNYEGGIIAPGLKTSLDALVRNTAKLPRIEFSWPKNVIGKNTVQCMQSGSIVGYACMVEGLLEKLQQEVGPIEHVLATGGLGKIFSEHCKGIKRYEPQLTLEGMRIIAELNR